MKRLLLTTLMCMGLLALANRIEGSWSDCCPANFYGFYVGTQIGWIAEDRVWSDRDAWLADITGDAVGSLFKTNSGGLAGVGAGYNWQCGSSLLGIEGDWNWGSLRKERDHHLHGFTLNFDDRTQWFGTIRGRAGIAMSKLLLYATGGVAFAQFRHSWGVRGGAAREKLATRHNLCGFAAGAGAEWACTALLSIKVEALYLKFPEQTKSLFSIASAARRQFSFDETIWLARVGLNFRFTSFSSFCCW